MIILFYYFRFLLRFKSNRIVLILWYYAIEIYNLLFGLECIKLILKILKVDGADQKIKIYKETRKFYLNLIQNKN